MLAGDTLFEQGAEADALYVVLSGRVALHRRVHREELLLELLGENHVLGEMCLVPNGRHLASARVVEDATVLVVERESLEDTLADRPEVERQIRKHLALRLAHAHYRMGALTMTSIEGRVLYQLRQEWLRAGEEGRDGFHPIPGDLPQVLGIERASVDQCLRAAMEAGFLEVDMEGRFRVVDRDALERRLAFLELADRYA